MCSAHGTWLVLKNENEKLGVKGMGGEFGSNKGW